MPHTKSTTVYYFDELSDKAKEKARDWYRQGALDYEWWDYVFEDANTIATSLGFDLLTKRANPAIWFSGFSSQGDGACFEGTYRAERCKPGDFFAHVGLTESNKPIVDIADSFIRFAKEHPTFYANLTHSGRYNHEYTIQFDCSEDVEKEEETVDRLTKETEKEFIELSRNFMRWIYRQLEKEHDYLISDESVDESIRINEYEFAENGHRA